ncbi:putative macrolide export ATP-binding/permease protein [Gottschalkia acidurici 9a]|uniref:Macrolide export ATP-binding/permease protein n=1 Tax=Gottschalkia acidurici (strain ATCC 7906 / DSM 604 / BCRC 14475 / CIP 104303 / KCTC 5404 / NCIMB 10678 / 9a) TaxID=1128398 RepID=K0ATF7_GOTA9|nr:putative bacteriocin export ABC transporter [Gottschalkia acidurici]AFS77143.1 putative macrolide export ATP-binding/permease protein [Gottschalkia acidurici 9a]
MSIISLKNINKSFGSNKILDNFNLEIEKGEFIAIVGESGSGKSTLLNIIGMLDDFDSGELIVSGNKNLKSSSKDAEKLRRHEIGYIFQNFALIDNVTVSENLDIALTYRDDIKDKENVKLKILKEIGLPDKINSKIYELSGGEQQRVSISMVFLKPCNIILADEPTGSLDDINKEIIMDFLKKVNKGGKTVIIVTHDKDVSKMCNKIVKLK